MTKLEELVMVSAYNTKACEYSIEAKVAHERLSEAGAPAKVILTFKAVEAASRVAWELINSYEVQLEKELGKE